eukprot:gene10080-7050_t
MRRLASCAATHILGQPPVATGPQRSIMSRVEELALRVMKPVVEKLQSRLVFADERMVTESRRKLQRMPAMEEALPQRIQRQRRIRQVLVPSEIRVSRSRLHVTFVWPEVPDATYGSSSHAVSAGAGSETVVGSSVPSSTTSKTTTALAEYLRVYTPSTDGTFATDRVVYGRRGVTIKDFTPIGNYAVRISFSDQHDAGIYSYDYLYHLTCPEHKFRLMREYIRTLRAQRKSRTPPRRVASSRRLEKAPEAAAVQVMSRREKSHRVKENETNNYSLTRISVTAEDLSRVLRYASSSLHIPKHPGFCLLCSLFFASSEAFPVSASCYSRCTSVGHFARLFMVRFLKDWAYVVSFFGPFISLGLIIFGIFVPLRLVIPVLWAEQPNVRLLFNGLVVFIGGEMLLHLFLASYYSFRIGGITEAEESGKPAEDGNNVPVPIHQKTPAGFCPRLCMALWPQPPSPSRSDLEAIQRYIETAEAMPLAMRREALLDAPRRHCNICRRFKAPREHHCAICGTCVPRMDHHCVFIDNCVDVLNYRYFVSLLVWIMIGSVFELCLLLHGYWSAVLPDTYTDMAAHMTGLLHNSTALNDYVAAQYGLIITSKALRSAAVVRLMATDAFFILMMAYFLFKTLKGLIHNTTAVEEAVLEGKADLFVSTSFMVRSPYNLGFLPNVLEAYGRPHLRSALHSSSLSRRLAAEVVRRLELIPPPPPPTDVSEAGERGVEFPQGRTPPRRTLHSAVFIVFLLVVPIMDDGSTYDGVTYPTTLSPQLPDIGSLLAEDIDGRGTPHERDGGHALQSDTSLYNKKTTQKQADKQTNKQTTMSSRVERTMEGIFQPLLPWCSCLLALADPPPPLPLGWINLLGCFFLPFFMCTTKRQYIFLYFESVLRMLLLTQGILMAVIIGLVMIPPLFIYNPDRDGGDPLGPPSAISRRSTNIPHEVKQKLYVLFMVPGMTVVLAVSPLLHLLPTTALHGIPDGRHTGESTAKAPRSMNMSIRFHQGLMEDAEITNEQLEQERAKVGHDKRENRCFSAMTCSEVQHLREIAEKQFMEPLTSKTDEFMDAVHQKLSGIEPAFSFASVNRTSRGIMGSILVSYLLAAITILLYFTLFFPSLLRAKQCCFSPFSVSVKVQSCVALAAAFLRRMLRELFVPPSESSDEPLSHSNDGSFPSVIPGFTFAVEPKDRSFHLPLARTLLPPLITFVLLLMSHSLVGVPPLFFEKYTNRVTYVWIMILIVSLLGGLMEYFCVTRSFLPLSRTVRRVTKSLEKRQGDIIERLKRETEEFEDRLRRREEQDPDGTQTLLQDARLGSVGMTPKRNRSRVGSMYNYAPQLNIKAEVDWLHEELHTLIKKLPRKSSVTLRWQAPMLEALLGALHDIDMSLMQVAVLMTRRENAGLESSTLRRGRSFTRRNSFVSVNSRQPASPPTDKEGIHTSTGLVQGSSGGVVPMLQAHPSEGNNTEVNPFSGISRTPFLQHSTAGFSTASPSNGDLSSDQLQRGLLTPMNSNSTAAAGASITSQLDKSDTGVEKSSPASGPSGGSAVVAKNQRKEPVSDEDESGTLDTVPEAGIATEAETEHFRVFRERMAAEDEETESIDMEDQTKERRTGGVGSPDPRGVLPRPALSGSLSIFRGDRFATDNSNVFFFIMLVRVQRPKRGQAATAPHPIKPVSSSIVLFEAVTMAPISPHVFRAMSKRSSTTSNDSGERVPDKSSAPGMPQFFLVPRSDGEGAEAQHPHAAEGKVPFRVFAIDRETNTRRLLTPREMELVGLECLGIEQNTAEVSPPVQRGLSDTCQDPSDVTDTRTPHQSISLLPESFIVRWRSLPKRPMRLTFLQVMLHATQPSVPPTPYVDPMGHEWTHQAQQRSGTSGMTKKMVPVMECEIDHVLSVLLSAVVTVDDETDEVLSVKLRGSSIEASARSSEDNFSSWSSESGGRAETQGPHPSGGGRLEVGMTKRETLILGGTPTNNHAFIKVIHHTYPFVGVNHRSQPYHRIVVALLGSQDMRHLSSLTFRHTKMAPVLYFAAVLLAITLASASEVASESRPVSSSMRCQRPLSAFQGLEEEAAIAAKGNTCDFTYFSVTDAHVHIQCGNSEEYKPNPSETVSVAGAEARPQLGEGGGRMSCSVSVSLDLHPAANLALLLQHQFAGDSKSNEPIEKSEEWDKWRFSVALSHAGSGEIHYKGFDHNGYSMCCDLLKSSGTAAPGTYCSWTHKTNPDKDVRMLEKCPLPQSLTEVVNAKNVAISPLTGVITKPLPVLAPGQWLAKIRMWRVRSGAWTEKEKEAQEKQGKEGEGETNDEIVFMNDEENVEVLGRVMVSFHVGAEDLPELSNIISIHMCITFRIDLALAGCKEKGECREHVTAKPNTHRRGATHRIATSVDTLFLSLHHMHISFSSIVLSLSLTHSLNFFSSAYIYIFLVIAPFSSSSRKHLSCSKHLNHQRGTLPVTHIGEREN